MTHAPATLAATAPAHEPRALGAPRRSLRSYLALVLYKTYADLRAESERTFVGFLWWIGEPLVSLLVYYTVFELLFNRGMVEHYAVFLFIGLVPWKWLSQAIMHGAHAIRSARGLMQLVYLPKIVFPIVVVLTDTVKFLMVFFALVLICMWIGSGISTAYLSLPVVLLAQGLFLLGLAMVVGAITPFFPDIYYVLENLLRLWFFLSGIFYPLTSLPERAQFYFGLNPMLRIIEAYRAVLLHGEMPVLMPLVWIMGASLGIIAVGALLLTRFDYAYPKLTG